VRTENVGAVHGAVLGLCAFVAAFPHQVPDFLPELLLYLGTFISARQPVSGI
jgi:proteasome activator subunit 4